MGDPKSFEETKTATESETGAVLHLNLGDSDKPTKARRIVKVKTPLPTKTPSIPDAFVPAESTVVVPLEESTTTATSKGNRNSNNIDEGKVIEEIHASIEYRRKDLRERKVRDHRFRSQRSNPANPNEGVDNDDTPRAAAAETSTPPLSFNPFSRFLEAFSISVHPEHKRKPSKASHIQAEEEEEEDPSGKHKLTAEKRPRTEQPTQPASSAEPQSKPMEDSDTKKNTKAEDDDKEHNKDVDPSSWVKLAVMSSAVFVVFVGMVWAHRRRRT
jgi:hypothetical protein